MEKDKKKQRKRKRKNRKRKKKRRRRRKKKRRRRKKKREQKIPQMNLKEKSVPKTKEKTTHKEDNKANVQSSSSVDSRDAEEKKKLLLNAIFSLENKERFQKN